MQLTHGYFVSITNYLLIFCLKKNPRFSEQNTVLNKFFVSIVPNRDLKPTTILYVTKE